MSSSSKIIDGSKTKTEDFDAVIKSSSSKIIDGSKTVNGGDVYKKTVIF